MDKFDAALQISNQIGCDVQEFLGYMDEDNLGGYHIDESQRKFPMGSAWGIECQILYALVRVTKAKNICEVGGWAGCSASHIALALGKNNNGGKLISVDSGVGGQEHGYLIPKALRSFVELVKSDGVDWLQQQDADSIDLIFEDADHSTQLVRLLSQLALSKLRKGGILVNHDASHDFAFLGDGSRVGSNVGREVRDGLSYAGAKFKVYLVDPSDCGVAITVKDESAATPLQDVTAPLQSHMSINQGFSTELLKQMMDSPDLTAEEKAAWAGVLPQNQTGIAPIESNELGVPNDLLPPPLESPNKAAEGDQTGKTLKTETPEKKPRKPRTTSKK